MEAEDNCGDSAELWVTLNAMGYNYNLQQDEAALFQVKWHLYCTRLWTLWTQNELNWYFQRGRNHVNSSNDVIFIGVCEMRIWKIGSGFLRQRFAFRRVYPRQGDDSMHNGGIFGTQNSRWSQGGHRFQRGSDKYHSLLFQNSNFTNGPEIFRKNIAQAFLTLFR